MYILKLHLEMNLEKKYSIVARKILYFFSEIGTPEINVQPFEKFKS